MTCRADGIRLPLRIMPGVRSDSYLCPCCKEEQERYQLRRDRFNVPRRVDVAGDLCDKCLDMLRDLED